MMIFWGVEIAVGLLALVVVGREWGRWSETKSRRRLLQEAHRLLCERCMYRLLYLGTDAVTSKTPATDPKPQNSPPAGDNGAGLSGAERADLLGDYRNGSHYGRAV